MEIVLGHKIRLVPNREQSEYFSKACGIARFAWNWGLPNGNGSTEPD